MLQPYASKDVVQMPQMIAEVKAAFNLVRREVLSDIGIGEQERLERFTRLPRTHGMSLHQPIGRFPSEPLPDQREHHRLRKYQPSRQLQIVPHAIRIDPQTLKYLPESNQQVVKQDGCIGQNYPLYG